MALEVRNFHVITVRFADFNILVTMIHAKVIAKNSDTGGACVLPGSICNFGEILGAKIAEGEE